MSHEILMSVENGLLRIAQVEDGELTAITAAPPLESVRIAVV